jgi:hypothetical protein
MVSNLSRNVEQAISKLKSLRDAGDLGVVEAVACGKAASPAPRDLLFQGELSRPFQARCRAIEALAALYAYSVMIEYLNAAVLSERLDGGRTAADPVERLGDDAVINIAAIALAEVRDERVFRLLQEHGKRPSLSWLRAVYGGTFTARSEPPSQARLEFFVGKTATFCAAVACAALCMDEPSCVG